MKFTEGLVFGTLLTATAMLMYSDDIDDTKKKMIKKGKQFLKKLY